MSRSSVVLPAPGRPSSSSELCGVGGQQLRGEHGRVLVPAIQAGFKPTRQQARHRTYPAKLVAAAVCPPPPAPVALAPPRRHACPRPARSDSTSASAAATPGTWRPRRYVRPTTAPDPGSRTALILQGRAKAKKGHR